MYKVCIFDLDGTIADTVESIAHVGNQTLRAFGLPEIPVKDYNFYAGDGADVQVKRMLAAVPGGDKVDYEEVRTQYRKWFAENPFYHVKPYDGILELLEGLKAQGIKIAVLSNKPHGAAVEVVHKIFGQDMFHKIQGQTSEIPRKPSPIGALAVAKEFGALPQECLYCGDTNTDMDTGKAAGMFTIGVTWGFRPRIELEEHHADKIVDQPSEILELASECR
nr:HAD family hydrolase [uncultured Blautia sp.]